MWREYIRPTWRYASTSIHGDPQDEYYKEMLKNLNKVNNNEGEPLSNENLQQAVIDLREEMDV